MKTRVRSFRRLSIAAALCCPLLGCLPAVAQESENLSLENLSLESSLLESSLLEDSSRESSLPESSPFDELPFKDAPRLAASAVGESTPQTTPAGISAMEAADDEAPERFRRALRERDFSIGYGRQLPFSRFDGRTDVTIVQFLPRWGRFRDDRQEFLWEAPVTVALSPDTAYSVGLALMYRYHFSSSRRFAPFVEFGSGIQITNFYKKFREVSGAFQFTPQAGIGARASIGRNSDLVIAARWYHVSNGGLKKPNTGLNNYLVTLGYSRLF